ncbi:putative glycosyltransferase [Austwickia chelonae NBRC 105200]|uniref:Putative glycosyltransferase n=1 Tax=Austwickia chelonae NBRC 105200 TaxID=1184607 RepID=K6VMU1_9MICO|nr:putative glycosyltransferase [Austwickia chelonae NBRC 105200]
MVVWRSHWLAPSETFIADHLAALRRYAPIPLGLYRDDDRLGVRPQVAPFPHGTAGLWALRLAARLGYRGIYDRAVERGNACVIHAHFGMDAAQVLPLARRLGLPLVVTFHGWDVVHFPHYDDARSWYLRRLPEVFEYASALLPVSNYLRGRLLELGAPPEKTHVHYLGIPVPENLPPPDSPRSEIVFVGRLTPRKGVTDLISAVEALPPNIRRSHEVRILGEGPQRAELERRAARITDTRFHFEGRVAPERVAQALSRARLFVGPSTLDDDGAGEAFGLTFLEAARAGAPQVGYAAAGLLESVADGISGILVPPGDIPALSEAMAQVLSDPELAIRLGQQGQERVRREFDLCHRTALLEARYDELSGGRAAGHDRV